MTEEHKHRLLQFARIRRAKFWLRYMPRRARFHTYPIVGRFAAFARPRSYLWRFNYPGIRPAFYFGSVLTLIPIPGQLPLGFLLCLLFRTNFMIMGALQFVSNPATGPFLLYGTYKLGAITLNLTGLSSRQDAPPAAAVFEGSLDLAPIIPPLEEAPPDLETTDLEPKPTPWLDRFYRILGDQLPPRGQPITAQAWVKIAAHLLAAQLIGAIIAGLTLGAALDLLWRWLVLPAARHHAARKPVTGIITPHSATSSEPPLPPDHEPLDTPPLDVSHPASSPPYVRLYSPPPPFLWPARAHRRRRLQQHPPRSPPARLRREVQTRLRPRPQTS